MKIVTRRARLLLVLSVLSALAGFVYQWERDLNHAKDFADALFGMCRLTVEVSPPGFVPGDISGCMDRYSANYVIGRGDYPFLNALIMSCLFVAGLWVAVGIVAAISKTTKWIARGAA